MSFDTYDPAQLNISFNGFLLSGFMDGTFVSAERKEDAWTPHVGADGEYARARNRNKSGTVKFTLMQTSSSNDYLSSQMNLDEATGAGTGVLQIKDALGRTVITGADAYIMKPAPVQYGKELAGREWTLEVPQLDVFVGGNGVT
jgi:hypothetical protein